MGTVYTCQRCSTETNAIERLGIDWLCPVCAYVQQSIEGRTRDFAHVVGWKPLSIEEMLRDDAQASLGGYA